MKNVKTVLTLGEPMGLWIASTPGIISEVREFKLEAAGAEMNVAIGLSRLGHKVRYLSRVGDDAIGQFLTSRLRAEGVDCSFIAVDEDHSTGTMMKSHAENGEDPLISYLRKNSAASHLAPEDLSQLTMQHVHHLHLTGIAPALSSSCLELVLEAVRLTKEQGGSISFDPNIRPALWPSQQKMIAVLNSIACACDWILPGLEEGRLLTGGHDASEVSDFYLRNGAKAVIVKLGPAGAFYSTNQESGFVQGYPVSNVVDTVGAGDGFATGVISALLEGLSIRDATKRGNQIGSIVVQFPGDNDGLPNRDALEK